MTTDDIKILLRLMLFISGSLLAWESINTNINGVILGSAYIIFAGEL